jgi:uncharacterized protein with ATP-grasp and redox domains
MDQILLFPECASCILKTVEQIIKSSKVSREKGLRITQDILFKMAEGFLPTRSAVDLANEIFSAVVKFTENPDPFLKEKHQANTLIKRLLPKLEASLAQIPSAEERFQKAVRLALLGNSIDVGTAGHTYTLEAIEQQTQDLSKVSITIDDSQTVYESISPGDSILYIADNAGEIGFDLLLIQELQKKKVRVNLAVKGGPISNDATLIDAQEVGADRIVSNIITTGASKLGVPMKEVSQPFLQTMQKADLIISKGQSNYESLLPYVNEKNHRPVWFLLRGKCGFIAESLEAQLGSYISKYYK